MTSKKSSGKKTFLFVGGGSGGHIMPLIPVMREMKEHDLHLVSADQDIDKTINSLYIPGYVHCHYIRTGKLRRYFDWENVLDIVRTVFAIWKANRMIENIKPKGIFLKGGYVGVPFVIANKLFKHNLPIFTHESDRTSGIATIIANIFAQKTFGNFKKKPAPLFFVPEQNPQNPYKTKRSKILVLSGSLGGVAVNNIIEQNAEKLLKKHHVTVISGKGKALDIEHPHFEQHELVSPSELANYLHFCDIVISRGGANSLFEIINAKKPSIIIPLPSGSSRGDQYLNAKHFADQGLCTILEQEDEQTKDLTARIQKTLEDKHMMKALKKTDIKLKAHEIAKALLEIA